MRSPARASHSPAAMIPAAGAREPRAYRRVLLYSLAGGAIRSCRGSNFPIAEDRYTASLTGKWNPATPAHVWPRFHGGTDMLI